MKKVMNTYIHRRQFYSGVKLKQHSTVQLTVRNDIKENYLE